MMISFDKTITVYDRRYEPASRKTTWRKTVIHGASWAGAQRVAPGEGLRSNDSYSVRIPASALPAVFEVKNGDVALLGVGPEAGESITEVTRLPDSFTVTAVNTANLSRPLAHMRLEGK
jgi:hypothetical protein